MKSILLATALVVVAGPTVAGCLTAGSGAKCVAATNDRIATKSSPKWLKAPKSADRTANLVSVGERLPQGYSILLNTEYYGLPPVEASWIYYRVGHDVVRVDRRTREVLAFATDETNAAF